MFRRERHKYGGGGSSGRMYGFFQCSKCNAKWESAHVHRKVLDFYQQECKRCRVAVSPYNIEPIKCSNCHKTECTCTDEDREMRHNDNSKPHRRDLCERCQKGLKCGEY